MKTITITGDFSSKTNNYVRVDVYESNPGTYDLSKSFSKDFTLLLDDLQENSEYFIDFTGVTFGTFNLSIDGDIVEPAPPIVESFVKTSFKPGYIIKTNN